MGRLISIASIFFCLEVGLFLMFIPWSELWEGNYLLSYIPTFRPLIVHPFFRSGVTALVHPLTDDDLADHTTLGVWIGEPLPLKLSVLDPPGMNQGIARFGKSDF